MSILNLLAGIVIGIILGATVVYKWANRQIGGLKKDVSTAAADVAKKL